MCQHFHRIRYCCIKIYLWTEFYLWTETLKHWKNSCKIILFVDVHKPLSECFHCSSFSKLTFTLRTGTTFIAVIGFCVSFLGRFFKTKKEEKMACCDLSMCNLFFTKNTLVSDNWTVCVVSSGFRFARTVYEIEMRLFLSTSASGSKV